MIFKLRKDVISFPDPVYAERNGLLAVGGDLSVARLVEAYRHGIFPWYEQGEPYLWWCPRRRFVIFPDKIHVSHSMAKFMRRHACTFQINRDFADTIHRCRMKREFAEGTWITDDMETAYTDLHRAGFAMSAEALIDGKLAGGLYGVVLGKCFFGESMYSDLENGSKLALIFLANHLRDQGFVFIDCQFYTEHLASMGGEYLSYRDYMKLVRKGLGERGKEDGRWK